VKDVHALQVGSNPGIGGQLQHYAALPSDTDACERGDGSKIQRAGEKETPGIKDNLTLVACGDPHIAAQQRQAPGQFHSHGFQHPIVQVRKRHSESGVATSDFIRYNETE
jgi:hypothetical protein